MKLVDILFINVDGVQTLAYKMEIVVILLLEIVEQTWKEYLADLTSDIPEKTLIRVRDLAVINSEFTLDVRFRPFQFRIFGTKHCCNFI